MEATQAIETRSGDSRRVSGSALVRADWIVVALIFGVALVLRLLHLQQLQLNDPFFENPSPDPRLYNDWALAIARGDVRGEGVFLQGPLFPYLLALEFRLFGHSFWLPRFIQCLLGAMSCVLTWGLARELFDRRIAALAGAMAALYGMAIFYGGSLLIANLLVPLNLMVLYSAVRAGRAPRPAAWAELGVWTGLAILARPNMLLYIPFVFSWVAWLCWEGRGDWGAGRRRWLSLAGFSLAVALCLAPSLVRNIAVADDWVLVTASAGMNFYNGNNPDANGTHRVPNLFARAQADHPLEQNRVYREYAEKQTGEPLRASAVSRFWFARGFGWVAEHPGEWLTLLGRKALLFWSPHELWNNRSFVITQQFSWVLRLPFLKFGVLAPFAILGIVVTWRKRSSCVPLYGLIAVYFATGVLFFVLSRYRLPIVPALLVFAAAGAVWCWDRVRERRWKSLVLATAGTLACAWVFQLPRVASDLSVAYYNVANRFLAQARYGRAIALYRESLAINPAYISAHNNLAQALEHSGNHPEAAVAAWQRVLALAERRGLETYIEKATRHLDALNAEAPTGAGREAK